MTKGNPYNNFSSYDKFKAELKKDLSKLADKLEVRLGEVAEEFVTDLQKEIAQAMDRAINMQLQSPAEAGAANEALYKSSYGQYIMQAPIVTRSLSTGRKWRGKQFMALSRADLDQIERLPGEFRFDVAIKSSKQSKGPGVYLIDGQYMRLMSVRIRSRVERNRGNWKLWEAMEYGGTPTNASLVRVTSVVGKKRGSGEDANDQFELGPEYVFMTKRSAWWKSRELDPFVRVFDSSEVYWGGAAPIRSTIARKSGELDDEVAAVIDQAVRSTLKLWK